MAIDLFATHKRMLYSALPKLSLMKDTSLDVHHLTPESKHCYTDGDQKVWSQNKGESKVREMKSPSCFLIVH